MKYLVFSTIGNENFGDESMATNYINKNIGWQNCDLISYYSKNASQKVNANNIFNPFYIFQYNSKLKKILFLIKVIFYPKQLIRKISLPRNIKEYDSFIMSGGGNLNGEYIDTLIYMYLISKLFNEQNKNVFYRPQSIGPFKGFKGKIGKIILKRILNISTEFLVRETESYKLAKSLVDHEKIKLQIDDAWTLDIEELEDSIINKLLNTNTKKIAISARPWNSQSMYIEKLSEVVDKALLAQYEVYFIPIAFGGDENYIDNAFIKNLLKDREGVYFVEDYLELESIKSENIKWIISKMDKCIGLSYHFNVFSKSLNKRTIALFSDKYYYIKNFGLYSLLNSENDVVNINDLNSEHICNILS